MQTEYAPEILIQFEGKKPILKHVPVSIGNSIRNTWLRPE